MEGGNKEMSVLTKDVRKLFRRKGAEAVSGGGDASRVVKRKGARRTVRTGCRPSQYLWERIRLSLLFSALFGLMYVSTLQSNPLMTPGDALLWTAELAPELPFLLGLEVARQLLIFAAERSRRFYSAVLAVTKVVTFPTRRMNERAKMTLSRVGFWLFILVVYALVASKFTGTGPVQAIFDLPSSLVSALPMLMQLAFAFFFVIFQFVGLFWFLSRGGVETYFPEDIKTRFDQVWGQDHVVTRLKENLLLLEDPESIEARGGHVPSGILLWGPPGTGKTLMAEAIAGETGKPYVFVDPGAFTNMFMGVGILKVKSLFRKLRKLSLRFGGVIVFFDEADSLGNRGGAISKNTGGEQDKTSPAGDPRLGSCHAAGYLSAASIDAVAGTRDGMMMGGMMGGAGAGTLQALLTELQGLKKPRGFFNRVIRRSLGMRPKEPPKYRILVMMATNMPDSLDPALLRPGRIDRIYRVGYPSKEGRIRTYQGYLAKVSHNLSDEDIVRLATATPYATGAKIKDLVNEALISAIGRGADVISWQDVIHAKHLKDLGPSEGVIYTDREQHSVAIHEACHAVAAYRLRKHLAIDVATIEKGAEYLGMVSSIPFEEMFSAWSSYYESDIAVAIASIVGERMFFGGDSTSGVSGDLDTATRIAALMETRWGMGATLASTAALGDLHTGPVLPQGRKGDASPRGLGERVEARLNRIYESTRDLLVKNRAEVLSVAHALEVYKTLTGPDVEAVINRVAGPLVDGTFYSSVELQNALVKYHDEVLEAHREHRNVRLALPTAWGTAPAEVEEVNPSPKLVEGAWPQYPDEPNAVAKSSAKAAPAKKTSAAKAPAKSSPAKAASAKKTSAAKSPAKASPAKAAPAKKSSAAKAPAKSSPGKKPQA
jgi:ATP-dependent Zn protease